jgi:hypothetical protein
VYPLGKLGSPPPQAIRASVAQIGHYRRQCRAGVQALIDQIPERHLQREDALVKPLGRLAGFPPAFVPTLNPGMGKQNRKQLQNRRRDGGRLHPELAH